MSYRRDNNNERGPGPIPKRWLHCPNKSNALIAEKFIAFKTPLSERFDSQVADELSFAPEMLLQLMKDVYKIKIGLWIDLTNTNRFYDRNVIDHHGCQYVKLNCRGFGEAPSEEQTKSFIEIVDTFIADHPFEIIGVHCTHGFNRTGFLIAAYMVEKMDCSVEAAIGAFAKARPPGIYKSEYIKELFRRYDDEEDAFAAPELPDWCYDEEETPDDYEDPGNNSYSLPSSHPYNNQSSPNKGSSEEKKSNKRASSSSEMAEDEEPNKKKKRPEFLNLNATFMIGVPGVSLVTDKRKVNTLQQMVQEMCNWSKGGFPGSQPVSMDINNINLLHTKPYRVSWKADGTRYMMLVKQEGEVYFFDRDNSCFEVVGLRFLNRKDLTKHIRNTLIDGEMVLDKVNGQTIPRYLIYDLIKFEGEDLGKQPFYPHRFRCIQSNLIAPRHVAIDKGIINKEREPFGVRVKEFWEVTTARKLLGPKFAKSLSHEPDGLIFQPSLDPYLPGQCDQVLKWKPLDQNSVDFKLKISEESGEGIVRKKIGLLYVGQMATPFSQIKFSRTLKDLDNKIIECKYENNQWTFMRERTDKSYPNSYNTAMAVCHSIKYPVTTAHLMEFIDKQRFMDDNEIMPPPKI